MEKADEIALSIWRQAYGEGIYPEQIAAEMRKFAREAAEQYTTLHPAEDYHEDFGNVLWWHLPVCEPPLVGSMNDIEPDDVPRLVGDGWLTHWSRIPIVWDGDGQALKIAGKEGK